MFQVLEVRRHGKENKRNINMKKIYFSLLLTAFAMIAMGQGRNCPSKIDLSLMQTQDPARYQRFQNLQTFTTNYINNQGGASYRLADPNGIIIIPVVVHVLHRNEAVGTGRNISLAQIQSQIDVLNEDFRRLNADRTNTPAAFTGVASDYNFEFRLACQDPNGNTTNGVLRRLTNKTNFQYVAIPNTNGTPDENAIGIKMTSISGEDPWPTDRYLNIWVGDFNDGTFGYATFPADFAVNPNVDGVVISTTMMGRVGNVSAPFDRGRTATHEVGHWLDLRHIWGDANCGDDFVADTPQQQTSNGGCPAFPHRTCGNTTNGDMFMNYMDYTDDGCMNVFTNGQRNRGRALFAVGGARATFIDNYFQLQQPGIICSTGTINLRNPNCLQPTWSVVSGTATITPVGTNQATITSTVAGTVTIRAAAGNYTSETTFNIVVGTPPMPTGIIGPDYDLCMARGGLNVVGTYSVDNPLLGIAYQWQVVTSTGQTSPAGSGISINLNGARYPLGCHTVRVRSISCSTFSPWYESTFCVIDCASRSFSIQALFPNPASDEVIVVFGSDSLESQVYSLKLVNTYQEVVYEKKTEKTQVTIPVSKIPEGIYYLNITDKDGTVQRRLLIKR